MTDRHLLLVVAGCARDADDCRLLLEAIGLIEPAQQPETSAPMLADTKHGRMRAYMAGCRCDDCRAKNAEERRKDRERAAADPSRADKAGHGKVNTYKNYGCRCADCREANRRWQREHNRQKRAAA